MVRWKYILGFLTLAAALVWLALFTLPDSNLHLIACDVGQGDAILATYKNTQILMDGGPDNSVLDCLARHMPFWDREIELVAMSHPQKDHYQGLIEVVRRYQVDSFLTSGLDSGNDGFQVLKKEVGSRGIRVVPSSAGSTIRLGLISLDILHPSEQFVAVEATKLLSKQVTNPLALYSSEKDPNFFSIVAILRFGEFDALLTGDIDPVISNQLSVNPLVGRVEYLKVPHHGSKNGLTQDLLEIIRPQVAVISAGKNNSYGHPHKEILDLLSNQVTSSTVGRKLLRTDLEGDVEIVTDGKRWW